MKKLIKDPLCIKVSNTEDLRKVYFILDFYNAKPYGISFSNFPYCILVYRTRYTDSQYVSTGEHFIQLTTEEFINKY